jgi:antitoxin HigA-1
MMKRKLREIPPGDILLHDFLEPMAVSVNRLARDIDVPPSRITDIVRNGRAITMDTAVRLGIYFGTSTEFWVNLQREYDLRVAARDLMPKIQATVKPYKPVAFAA